MWIVLVHVNFITFIDIWKMSKKYSEMTMLRLMNKGWKFLKKLLCCVGGGNKVIWLYQLSWKCKLATVTTYKATFRALALRQSEGLTLETSLWWPIYIFNLVDITKMLRLSLPGSAKINLQIKYSVLPYSVPWRARHLAVVFVHNCMVLFCL